MVAQAPPALHVSVSPTKAGTGATPRPVALKLKIDGDITATAITIYFPKQLRITNAGLKQCDKSDDEIIAGACDGMKAGTGSVKIGGEPLPLTPFVGVKDLLFQASDAVLHGKLSQAAGRYTAKMRVAIPDPMQTFSDITLNFKKTTLFATRGCPLPFKVTVGPKVLIAKASCT